MISPLIAIHVPSMLPRCTPPFFISFHSSLHPLTSPFTISFFPLYSYLFTLFSPPILFPDFPATSFQPLSSVYPSFLHSPFKHTLSLFLHRDNQPSLLTIVFHLFKNSVHFLPDLPFLFPLPHAFSLLPSPLLTHPPGTEWGMGRQRRERWSQWRRITVKFGAELSPHLV